MKKALKIILKVFLSLLGLILIIAAIAAIYVNRTFIHIDKKDKYSRIEIREISVDGFTFRDLNRNGKLDIYEDPRQPLTKRVNDLLSQMTREEKIRLLKGSGISLMFGSSRSKSNPVIPSGTIVAIPRLGIPSIILSDGPAGLRNNLSGKSDSTSDYCTAFPIGTLLASTWDTNAVKTVGEAMGNEMVDYGVDVILGPGVNIQRNPLCGRNFEYYSEDPVLTGNIGAAMVNGIESNGVGTSIKHFVANNQETNRSYDNVIVSERALREIYLKGFEIIVKKAQPWTVMSSYNKVNGTYTSESHRLLTDILRNEWGFEGVVMSDWYGGKNAPAQIHAGNDLLEPGTRKQYQALKKAAEKEELSETDINTSVRRILRLVLNSRKMKPSSVNHNPDLHAHARITRQAASEGMVLLKNDGTFPLTGTKNIALFGVTSYDFIAGGMGSGFVNAPYTISLEEGLTNAGYIVNKATRKVFEEYKSTHERDFKKDKGLSAIMSIARPSELRYSDSIIQECAGSADMAMITIGRLSGEGQDRVKKDDFLLSDDEQALINNVCAAFHAAHKKVAVILNIGGVIETASWKVNPDAILLAWQGGEEGGNSVADIVSGKVNPSGRLTMTFPIALEDCASSANFPMEGSPMTARSFLFGNKEKPKGEQVRNIDYTEYKEGIYVGYRHFDKEKMEVSYPFGYGLSYTNFNFENMDVHVTGGMISIAVKVKNTGPVAGKEVIEIYVSKPDSRIDRPVKELKAFAKTGLLGSGETTQMKLTIQVSDLAYWNEAKSGWTLEEGDYIIQAASSSRDIRLSRKISL